MKFVFKSILGSTEIPWLIDENLVFGILVVFVIGSYKEIEYLYKFNPLFRAILAPY
jgi:hypothetical protein